MSSSNHIVRSEVGETSFGYYTDEEIKGMSYCKVISPVTHDALGNSLQGGLYDPSMGPTDQSSPSCRTCGLIYMNCPGHPGHIELCVPVYHPMLFPNMFMLLRTKCAFCHKFRIAQSKARYTLIKLKLLEMGDVEDAMKLDDITSPPTKDSVNVGHMEDGDASAMNVVAHMKKFEEQLEAKLASYEHKYDVFINKQRNRSKAGGNRTSKVKVVADVKRDNFIKTQQREVIDEFYKLAIHTKKCDNCGAFSPAIRKDGHAKIFQKPLQKRLERTMTAMRLKLKSGLETIQLTKERMDDADGQTHGDDSDDEGSAVDSDDAVTEEEDSSSEDEDERAGNGVRGAKKSPSATTTTATAQSTGEADKYLVPLEVEAQLKLLWLSSSQPLLSYIWGRAISGGNNSGSNHYSKEEYKLFFMRTLLVPPNRFRPPSLMGDMTTEHAQNQQLSKVLMMNEKIANMNNAAATSSSSLATPGSPSSAGGNAFTQIISTWIDLQNGVNCFMDSAKDPNPLGGSAAPAGIRQLLERKEGLFRHHMMGKRVNYCCRSVISPDPYIGTNEIGIPLRFAKVLHYPTPVTPWNVKYLRQLVERGPNEYPGANQIEMPDGKIVKLDRFTKQERIARGRLLTSVPGIKVYRHLITGDALLVNRQPTLHKPGIMSHKARILTHMKEQTLRMNYANCNTYNADFDGDEMNCHFVQNELARAEAYGICNTDNQYIVPTSGNPLRGLIQDHVASAVKLTCKNTFLTKSEFQQLVFNAVSGLPGTEVVPYSEAMISNITPAVLKPQRLWTGKQVISALLAHLIRPPLPKLHLDGKTRTPATAMGGEQNEHVVIFRHGELLSGVMDKAAIGNVSFGIVHSVYEVYGAEMAGVLLTAFGRLFTYYLQDAGMTCGIEDLTLTEKADMERCRLLERVKEDTLKCIVGYTKGAESISEFVANRTAPVSAKEKLKAEKKLDVKMSTDRVNEKVKLDATMQSVINKSASDVLKACLPSGLERSFLNNNFSMMVMTGAKGSGVNQSQISCFLGQQALEGQRVPVMISGKTLPSFTPYDASPRAGGFVQDRFLTGVKPQEYYFHCMAGREGLVDTAVKTSRSGYLQRCLVKHLEELKVGYDMTVRDSGNNVVQFVYGEDGVDPVKAAFIAGKTNQMLFLARNHAAFAQKYDVKPDMLRNGLETDSATDFHAKMQELRALMKDMQSSGVMAPADASATAATSASAPPTASAAAAMTTVLKKGSVVLARRKKNRDLDWRRENVNMHEWALAEVVKVRHPKGAAGAAGGMDMDEFGSPGGAAGNADLVHRYDLRYIGGSDADASGDDSNIEKKVPIFLSIPAKRSYGGVAEGTYVEGRAFKLYLMQAQLPKETAMSKLNMNTAVGACSEKMQGIIQSYVSDNPDKIIVNKAPEQRNRGESITEAIMKGSNSLSTKRLESVNVPCNDFEMLVWVKYMRSLANPGEAVGCVAAQSIGEPSTQMTLNTFHLAGHGGANVTLGIPRLREIIMTASKDLKTPTMCVPLMPEKTVADAKLVARQISRLSLHVLLDHRGGVEVGEKIAKSSSTYSWERQYRVRFHFQNIQRIMASFGVNFSDIVGTVQGTLLKQLAYLIQLEKRRVGEKKAAKGSSLIESRKAEAISRGGAGGDDEEGGGRSRGGDDEDEGASAAASKKKSSALLTKMLEGGDDDDSDDEDDEDGGDEDAGAGASKLKARKKEQVGYGDEADNDSDSSSDDEGEATTAKKTGLKRTDDEDSDMEEEGDMADGSGKAHGKGKAAAAPTPSKKLPPAAGKSALLKDLSGLLANEDEGWVEFTLAYPTTDRRLLMAQLADMAARRTTIRATKGVSNAFGIEQEVAAPGGGDKKVKRAAIQVEGINFESMWSLSPSLVKHSEIQSNDIYHILLSYGVEAARQSIVSEIIGVFGVYGIDVNIRHLSLIADFMTRTGGYIPMNRSGMFECPSPFLQMTFETTCTFLNKAAQEGLVDNMESPSSRIVLGSLPKIGTGCFDVMVPLAKQE